MEKDSSPPSVLAIIAALNEEKSIGPSLAELQEVLEDLPAYKISRVLERAHYLKHPHICSVRREI